jgi:hypothetical protein
MNEINNTSEEISDITLLDENIIEIIEKIINKLEEIKYLIENSKFINIFQIIIQDNYDENIKSYNKYSEIELYNNNLLIINYKINSIKILKNNIINNNIYTINKDKLLSIYNKLFNNILIDNFIKENSVFFLI